jgi:hypothetical protein
LPSFNSLGTKRSKRQDYKNEKELKKELTKEGKAIAQLKKEGK